MAFQRQVCCLRVVEEHQWHERQFSAQGDEVGLAIDDHRCDHNNNEIHSQLEEMPTAVLFART